MYFKCPMCKTIVEELVNRYDVYYSKSEKIESIELEKPVCDLCVEELFYDIKHQFETEE